MRDLFPVRGTRDERIAAIAGLQRGRIARHQLRAAGITKAMIDRMLADGRLHRRHYGVYAVGHTASAEFARETEALLACPEGAVLSHHSAASLWNLRPEPNAREPVHVTIPQGTEVRKPGIRAHRTRSLHRKDIRVHKGLPVTSPARTHIDIAPVITGDELEQALDDALNHNLLRTTRAGRSSRATAVATRCSKRMAGP